MNRHVLLAGALLALGVVACADERTDNPTAPSLIVGAACNYPDLNKYARNLFGNPSDGADLARAMSNFAPNSAEATALAFDIFAEIAGKRDGVADFSSFVSDAANLTVETIKCANVQSTGAVDVATFEKALSPTGGYGVPTGVGSVLAKDGLASVNSPAGGFESWLGGRGLFYGFIPDNAAAPGESQSDLTGRTVYDWSLLRPAGAGALNGKGSVSLCVAYDNQLGIDKGQFRIQKLTNILDIRTHELDCSSLNVASAAPVPTGFFARLLHEAGSWLAPEPLHAAAFLGRVGTSPTGGAGNFSDFYAVNPNSVNLSFSIPPVDGTLKGGIPGANGGDVTVLVQGAGDTPWEGVQVKIFGVNNNGNFVEFSGNLATTNAQGLAVFPDLATNKNGGYVTFAATVPPADDPDVGAFQPDTTDVGVSINVRPK